MIAYPTLKTLLLSSLKYITFYYVDIKYAIFYYIDIKNI
jgi:hypothetical protein